MYVVSAHAVGHFTSNHCTISKAFDSTFEVKDYRKGKLPRHSRYHAWRGGTCSIANVIIFNVYSWASEEDRESAVLAAVVAVAFLGYFGGWWPAFREVTGRWPPTPTWTIEIKHRWVSLCHTERRVP